MYKPVSMGLCQKFFKIISKTYSYALGLKCTVKNE